MALCLWKLLKIFNDHIFFYNNASLSETFWSSALPENREDEDEEEDDEAGGDDEEGEALVLRPVGSILLHVGGAGGQM